MSDDEAETEVVLVPSSDSSEQSVAHPGLKRALKKRKELDIEKKKIIEQKRSKLDELQKDSDEKNRRRWERNYSSEDSVVKGNDNITTYYCSYCANPSLIIDISLSELPERKSDNSRVLNEEKHLFKRMMVEGETKYIKREGGLEMQCRLMCKECGLFQCYRPVPVGKKSKYCYFVHDALTDNPAKVKTIASIPIREEDEEEEKEEN